MRNEVAVPEHESGGHRDTALSFRRVGLLKASQPKESAFRVSRWMQTVWLAAMIARNCLIEVRQRTQQQIP